MKYSLGEPPTEQETCLRTIYTLSNREPTCCGLNAKCPLQTHASGHLVPSWKCCPGRLWNLQEVKPSEAETEAGLERI